MSVEKSFTSIGWGSEVRSPIRSPRMPGNSHSMSGIAALNLSRKSAMTSSVDHLAVGFEFDQKIAGVGLDHLEAQRGAGAAGIALDIRVRADDLSRRCRSWRWVSARLVPQGAT